MKAVLEGNDSLVNAFIAPSHVSAITGYDVYQSIVDEYQVPIVVAGFEPVDILQALEQLLAMRQSGKPALGNQYSRIVSKYGNQLGQSLVDTYFEVREDFNWRGLGNIANSALSLRDEYRHLNAEIVFAGDFSNKPIKDSAKCCCGAILKGQKNPADCALFGKSCKPNKPVGSCMVSSEGACNAYYRYASILENVDEYR